MILPGNEAKTLPVIIYEEMQGKIVIRGRSISAEVDNYFGDFLPYLDENITKNPIDLNVDIDLEYFNTKTAKLLMKMLNTFKKVINNGNELTITWYYEEGDEDMKEAGQDYEQMTGVKFNFIEKPEK